MTTSDRSERVTITVTVEQLAYLINRLDRIVGNGEEPTGVRLGLDYGDAEEWAEAIFALAREGGTHAVQGEEAETRLR